MNRVALPHRLIAAAALAAASVASFANAADANSDHVHVQLISEHLALVPGQSMQFGLLLRHEPHWHTYWINPGDSGLPTAIEWNLPGGLSATDVQWPLPKRFDVGGLYNFGYVGEIVLPVAIAVPADAKPGSTLHLAADAKWLVCRDECIPGKASLAIDLPVEAASAKPDPRWTQQFSRARLAEPQATAWKGEVAATGDRIVVTLRGPGLPGADGLDAFPVQRKLFDNKPPSIRREGDALVIESARSEYFAAPPGTLDLVLTAPPDAGVRGWHVQIPWVDASATAP